MVMDHRPAAAFRRARSRVQPLLRDRRLDRNLHPGHLPRSRRIRVVRRCVGSARGVAAVVEAPLSRRGAGDRRVRGSRQMGVAAFQRTVGRGPGLRGVRGFGLRQDARAIGCRGCGHRDHRPCDHLARTRPVSCQPDADSCRFYVAGGLGDRRLHAIAPPVLRRARVTQPSGICSASFLSAGR